MEMVPKVWGYAGLMDKSGVRTTYFPGFGNIDDTEDERVEMIFGK
jgi:hypothetical protein